MERRIFLKILAGACASTLNGFPAAQQAAGQIQPENAEGWSLHPGQPPGPAFEWLSMGEVKPAAWIRNQMLRDLHEGFAGCLDKLCPEASSDIFVSHRNTLATQNTSNEAGINWWNGETEGNWHAGHMMMAYLAEDPAAIEEADRYVKHILGSQDADGYLGIFAPDSRYMHSGELWTQACLLRGLLAYAELTGNEEVFQAVRRAADLSVKVYGSGEKPLPKGESHDLMIIDVLEWLSDRTGDDKYRDFSLWYYEQWSKNESKWDATLPSLLDLKKGFTAHGVNTYENIRVPLWLATATGRHDLRQARENAFVKIARYSEISGSGVSEEWIKNLPPDPSRTEYEYCATKELQLTFESALQKTGRAEYGDRVELIWFNAAQGARLPDGSAISYLTSDNRLRCNETSIHGKGIEKSNKFSPTHMDVAVCCNPNATQVAALFIRGMWMRHSRGGLVATLYGPCTVSTKVDGVFVRIEEHTLYPFESIVEFAVYPEREHEIPLYFRNPLWSRETHIAAAGARIEREGDYWLVRKRWNTGDIIRLEFTPQLEQIQAVNQEIAIKYGPLIFAQPLASKKKIIKRYSYDFDHFEDSIYEPAFDARQADLGFPAALQAKAFELEVRHPSAGANPDTPFDAPLIELHGSLVAKTAGGRQETTLVPLGNAPLLRRVTFPLVDEAQEHESL
ncbi:MAG: beta-L-arabinofuranosidase domain-containing protein [Acidobacteriaceae bacterium]